MCIFEEDIFPPDHNYNISINHLLQNPYTPSLENLQSTCTLYSDNVQNPSNFLQSPCISPSTYGQNFQYPYNQTLSSTNESINNQVDTHYYSQFYQTQNSEMYMDGTGSTYEKKNTSKKKKNSKRSLISNHKERNDYSTTQESMTIFNLIEKKETTIVHSRIIFGKKRYLISKIDILIGQLLDGIHVTQVTEYVMCFITYEQMSVIVKKLDIQWKNVPEIIEVVGGFNIRCATKFKIWDSPSYVGRDDHFLGHYQNLCKGFELNYPKDYPALSNFLKTGYGSLCDSIISMKETTHINILIHLIVKYLNVSVTEENKKYFLVGTMKSNV